MRHLRHRHRAAELAKSAGPLAPAIGASDDDLALLVYTSGTTGRPKGVELTHANIMAMATSMSAFTHDAHAHSLLILPLFHVNGIVVSILAPLLAGGQATVAGRFNPRTFFDIVEEVRPTYFSAVPTIYAMLNALPAESRPTPVHCGSRSAGPPRPSGTDRAVRATLRHPDHRGYGCPKGPARAPATRSTDRKARHRGTRAARGPGRDHEPTATAAPGPPARW